MTERLVQCFKEPNPGRRLWQEFRQPRASACHDSSQSSRQVYLRALHYFYYASSVLFNLLSKIFLIQSNSRHSVAHTDFYLPSLYSGPFVSLSLELSHRPTMPLEAVLPSMRNRAWQPYISPSPAPSQAKHKASEVPIRKQTKQSPSTVEGVACFFHQQPSTLSQRDPGKGKKQQDRNLFRLLDSPLD